MAKTRRKWNFHLGVSEGQNWIIKWRPICEELCMSYQRERGDMMKILKEVFPKCLVMLWKCKDRVQMEDQGWCLVGHMSGEEMDRGRNSLTPESWRKACIELLFNPEVSDGILQSQSTPQRCLGWGCGVVVWGKGHCEKTGCLFYFMQFDSAKAFVWKNNFAALKIVEFFNYLIYFFKQRSNLKP